MGQHAQPDGGSFYRSLGISAVRAASVLVLVALATAAVVILTADLSPGSPAMTEPDAAASHDGEEDAPAAQVVRPAGSPTATPAPGATPPPTESPTAERAVAADDEEQNGDATVEPPAQTTVQVLDGGAGPTATQEVVALLRGLGYDIVAVSAARCCYEETTVLYTSGNLPVARALADRDERFEQVRVNPNLSESVDVHVVVGRDWSR